MPMLIGETLTIPFVWTVDGVPTDGLSPAPTVDIIAPDGTVLSSDQSMTAQADADRYAYAFTAPATPGIYELRASTADTDVDNAYVSAFVEVGRMSEQPIVFGEVTADTTTTLSISTTLPAAAANAYHNRTLYFLDGDNAGVAITIDTSSDDAEPVLTFNEAIYTSVAPTAGDRVLVV